MSKTYYPILKSRAGELGAISKLPADLVGGMIPIFEVHDLADENPEKPAKTPKTIFTHVEACAKKIAKAWAGQCGIDFRWLPENPEVVTQLFDATKSVGLSTVPVVSTDTDPDLLEVVNAIVSDTQSGAMIRITHKDSPGRIRQLVTSLGVKEAEVDYILDFRGTPIVELKTALSRITHISKWRTLITASGVFPRSLSDLDRGAWHKIPRACWTGWSTSIKAKELSRVPSFSDYGTRYHGEPGAMGTPSTNIRYTKGNLWYVQQRSTNRKGGSADMIPLCQDLITQKFFAGADFSEGDRMFHEKATQPSQGPGSTAQWVEWSLNHHLVTVLRDLQAASWL